MERKLKKVLSGLLATSMLISSVSYTNVFAEGSQQWICGTESFIDYEDVKSVDDLKKYLGYEKEINSQPLSDWEHTCEFGFSYVGDYNKDAQVTLDDVSDILMVALGINSCTEDDYFLCSFYDEKEPFSTRNLTLDDVINVLNIAVGIEDKKIIECVHSYAAYESLEKNRPYSRVTGHDFCVEKEVFDSKKGLLEYLNNSDIADEDLITYVNENTDMETFKYIQAVLVRCPVYADSIDDVSLNDIKVKKLADTENCYVNLSDNNDILGEPTQYFTGLYFIDTYKFKNDTFTYKKADIECNVTGGESASFETYIEYGSFSDVLADKGNMIVISCEEELNSFKKVLGDRDKELDEMCKLSSEFKNALDLKSDYFEKNVLVVDIESMGRTEDSLQRKLYLTSDDNTINLNYQSTRYLGHNVIYYDLIYCSQIRLTSLPIELVSDKTINIAKEELIKYYDFIPEQESYFIIW